MVNYLILNKFTIITSFFHLTNVSVHVANTTNAIVVCKPKFYHKLTFYTKS